MARLSLDDVAWAGRWRNRSVAEKALLGLGLLLLAVTSPGPVVAAAVAAVAVTAALAGARVPAQAMARALAGPLAFIAVGVVAVVLSIGATPSGAGWSAGPFAVSAQSLDRGASVASRSVAAVCALVLLAATTPVTDLLSGLRRLRVPAELVEVAAVTYRMIFLLLDTQSAIRESQTARLGYATRRAAYRSLGGRAAATLVRAWTRAHRLDEGLAGRGYDGSLATLARSRPVSRPFVAGTLGVLAGLAALSAWSTVGAAG